MRDIERQNLRQIEALNQRGGRTLSLVDLMEAGTVTPEIVGFMLAAMRQGASVVMGAQPSGAGKSTLLANALAMLPPGEKLVTTASEAVIEGALRRQPAEPECYLAHEVGAGHWYAYIWGHQVRDFFRLMDTGRRIATCLHADTLAEMESILTGAPLFVDQELISRLGLVGFVHFTGPQGRQRRLVSLYARAPGLGLMSAFRWREEDGTFDAIAEPEAFGLEAELVEKTTEFARHLAASGERDFAAVRARIVEYYQGEGW